ncbi:hypothetical protein [Algoriphagus faecimaris]|nr:hypothetical protein [Algoriphagus faecimaris]
MKKVINLEKDMNSNKPLLLFDEAPHLVSQAIWQHFRPNHPIFIYKGGVKKLLNEAKAIFDQPFNFVVLYGKTGVGKSDVLSELKTKGKQVLNLEQVANHRGSTFGNLYQLKQTPQESFEIKLAAILSRFNPSHPIFTEFELPSLGKNIIPLGIMNQMENSKKVLITLSKAKRINRLVNDYAGVNDRELGRGIESLKSRLGKDKSLEIKRDLDKKQYAKVAEGLLEYFDNSISYQSTSNEDLLYQIENDAVSETAEKLLNLFKTTD